MWGEYYSAEAQGEAGQEQHEDPAFMDMVTLDVGEISRSLAWKWKDEKTVMLHQKVHVLKGLWSHQDPNWVIQLLERQAEHLLELELPEVSRNVLLAVLRIPWVQLRRLRLEACHEDLDQNPELPEEWRGVGLRRLEISGFFPKLAVQSLLQALRPHLRELQLFVGTPPAADKREFWPHSCVDLPAVLPRMVLHSLALERRKHNHEPSRCLQQMAAVRAAQPGCHVSCTWCETTEKAAAAAVGPSVRPNKRQRKRMNDLKYQTERLSMKNVKETSYRT